MEKTSTVTGKNMEVATQNAMEQLGLDRDSIMVELVSREKAGFFGIGASPCIIKVTYEVPDPVEAPKSALGAASRSKKKPEAPKVEPKAEAPKPEVKPAPALGQHTDEVLREIGYTSEEIAALRKKKVV